jgi:hypothetical protein
MTIATNADLKSQVAVILNRSNLTSQIPFYIQRAETRIAYGSEEQPYKSDPLRIRAMEQSSYATFNAQSIALPTGYLQHKRLYLSQTPNGILKYVTPAEFWNDSRTGTSGQPEIFTIESDAIYLAPTPDTSYTGKILYYKKPTALSADTDYNTILTNAPNVYLFGTLLEAFSDIRNDEQAQKYANKFAGAVNSANTADKADRHSSPWTARPDIYTP